MAARSKRPSTSKAALSPEGLANGEPTAPDTSKQPDIRQLARELGISVSTVSKALNGRHDVSEQLRDRVQSYAKERGYRANLAGRLLSSTQSRTIGIFLLSRDSIALGENLAVRFLDGILDVLDRNDYDAMLFSHNRTSFSGESWIGACRNRRVDGAIFLGLANDDPHLAELKATDLPHVLLDMPPSSAGPAGQVVLSQNREGVLELMSLLFAQGVRNPVFLTGGLNSQVAIERREAFFEACMSVGIAGGMLVGRFDRSSGYEAVQTLLSRVKPGKPMPDALVCSSDLSALGALKACREFGIKVPQQLALTGFDGISASEDCHPALTTLAQDPEAMGRAAADALLQRLQLRMVDFPRELRLPVKLVLRASHSRGTSVP